MEQNEVCKLIVEVAGVSRQLLSQIAELQARLDGTHKKTLLMGALDLCSMIQENVRAAAFLISELTRLEAVAPIHLSQTQGNLKEAEERLSRMLAALTQALENAG